MIWYIKERNYDNDKINRNEKQNIGLSVRILLGKNISRFDADLDACGLFS